MRPREPVTAYIGLGANLGDPVSAVQKALADLGQLPFTQRIAASGLYRTAPHEATGPEFINAVAALETRLTAPELLACLQQL